jgi:hypothetical protein
MCSLFVKAFLSAKAASVAVYPALSPPYILALLLFMSRGAE